MKIKAATILVQLAAITALPNATAVTNEATSLVCQTSRIADGGEVKFSLVFDESKRTVTLNGTLFRDVKFTPSRIDGSRRDANRLVPGVDRETSFSLDRMTGKFSLMMMPQPVHGDEFTEEQKARIVALPLDPSFIGRCTLAEPMF